MRAWLEAVVYGLAVGYWLLLALLGVGSDSVQFPAATKLALTVAPGILGVALLVCLLLRLWRPPRAECPAAHSTMVVLGLTSLALYLLCGTLSLPVMWFWN
jgi:hypothetical protein